MNEASNSDPASEAAYFASIWGLSNPQMSKLEAAFRKFAEARAIDALTAMGGKAEPVAVKPLEWRGPGNRHTYKSFDGVIYRADAPAQLRIAYEIWHYMERPGKQFLLRWKDQWYDTLEEAKADALFDYEARILSAISAPASPVQACTGEVTGSISKGT